MEIGSLNCFRLLNFNTHSIAQGPLNKMVGRRIHMLSFYQFTERLKQTATFYPSAVIMRGSEAYASKQCGGCGVLNDRLGGSEVFKFNECGLTSDMDMHAARNITQNAQCIVLFERIIVF